MSNSTDEIQAPLIDVGRIDCADLPFRAVSCDGNQRQKGFQVMLSAEAAAKIHAQGKASLKAEVGGVLVGNVYRDEQGPYLWVHAILEGRGMRHHTANVTFTADTWADIQQRMDREFPADRIVGWYHTHPGFGIFLSEMDLFIQRNFFNLPWQTALVYDPKSEDEGVFNWRNGHPTREDFMIVNPLMESAGTTVSAQQEIQKHPHPRLAAWLLAVGLILAGSMLILALRPLRTAPPNPAGDVSHQTMP